MQYSEDNSLQSHTAKQIKQPFSFFVNKWKHCGPAARPMKSELEQVEKYVASLPTGKMLVMGATPEYRDIGIRNGWETYALEHTKKYCWIPFDYDGPAWDKKYFFDCAQSFLKQGIDPKKKLSELVREQEILIKQQKEYTQTANLHKNSDYAYLFKLARELMYLKDYRKDVLFQSYYHMDTLVREVWRRLGLSPVQVKHILPSEMHNILVSRQYDLDELNDRIAYSVLVYDLQGIQLYTGVKAREIIEREVEKEKVRNDLRVLKGECAYTGKVKGSVRLIYAQKDMKKMNVGDILVSVATNPNLLQAIRIAGAIVTDKGGITSHAAIVSRELKIPCVTGTEHATQIFKDGDMVEVDANKGVVKIIKRANEK